MLLLWLLIVMVTVGRKSTGGSLAVSVALTLIRHRRCVARLLGALLLVGTVVLSGEGTGAGSDSLGGTSSMQLVHALKPAQPAPSGASHPEDTHVVRSGETLAGIAVRHGATPAGLAAANGIVDGRVLAGSRLRIGGPAVAVASGGARHTVRPGETLEGIAGSHGVAVDDLVHANGLAHGAAAPVGAALEIPGGWRCPVSGSVRFTNDFGVGKPDGRFHDGVDVFAPRGTPVVASVAGTVRQVESSRSGRAVSLAGEDGVTYFGAHLDRFGVSGRVARGDVIGFVGTSGNARGTPPHLHFEMRPNGEGTTAANPYPALRAACG